MYRPSPLLWLLTGMLVTLTAGGASGKAADPTSDAEKPTGEAVETEPAEAAEDRSAAGASDDEAVSPVPANNFRLYSRREIDLRLRPNAGLRLLPLRPIFSPRTADFYDRDRAAGQLDSIAASISFAAVDDERQSAKGQEFRDLSDGVAVGLDAQTRGTSAWFRITGRHLGLDDADVGLEIRRFGVLSARIDYSDIPHNYAFDAPTLYSGINTGRLEIDDAIQQNLQNSTSQADAADRVLGFLENAERVDVAHTRERLGVELDFTLFDPLAIEVVVKDESRQGSRPWSGSFGFNNVVEIPWPVDYDSEDARVTVEYAKGSTFVQGSARFATFDNQISDVIFDNPWRITDSARPAAIVRTFESGPATGQIDLYPSNEQQEISLVAMRRDLPGKSTLQASLVWDKIEQNDPLLPFTTNTAITEGGPFGSPFDAFDPANLPAERVDARFDHRVIHLRWTSKPLDLLSVKAHFRDDEVDNETAQIFITGFVPEDTAFRRTGSSVTNLPIAYSRTTWGVEFGVDLAERTRLTFAYDREDIDREFREVEATDEDAFKLSIDTKPAPWADLKASYFRSERDASEYDFDQFFQNQGIERIPILPFLRKFDQAARDRDRLQVMATFYPSESLVVGAQVIAGRDDYPESEFGLLDDEHEVYAADLSYLVNDKLSFFVSYSLEEFGISMRGREWFPGAVSDPFTNEPGFDSASNWTAETSDEIDTLTLGLDVDFIPDKLHLDLAFSYSKSDGEIEMASPVGTADLNPFELADFDEVDDVEFYNFNPELEYTVGEHIAVVLGYMMEKYEIQDINTDGLELVPRTPSGEFNGAILMGTFPTDFDLEVLYLRLKLGI